MPAALKALLFAAKKTRRVFMPDLLRRNPITLLPMRRWRSCRAGVPRLRDQGGFTFKKVRERISAFTLLELLVVTSIIAILMVLVAPAFTTLKSGGDVTSAAHTISDLLRQARGFAMANNTYVWIGFYEEDASKPSTSPATAGTGRIVISAVASKDGTIAYDQPVQSPSTPMDPSKLVQLGKLVKLENAHLRTFPNGTGTGETFPTRPAVPLSFPNNAKIGDTSPPASLRPFQYPVGNPSITAQYMFSKMFEFNPRGECRVNNNNFTMRTVNEVGMQPTHGAVVDDHNECVIQVSGVGGTVKIYRR